MRIIVATLLLIGVAFTGCISAVDPGVTEPAGTGDVVQLPDVTWESPQTTPHPAFGWPTINDPAEGFAGDAVPKWWRPIDARAVPDAITGVEHVANDGEQAPGGAGIAIFGSLAVVPSWNGDTAVFDISDPTNPTLLSLLQSVARDADIIAYPDGRLVTVLATDNAIVPVWDITDPLNPELLVELEPTEGSHNVAVVPGTPILYNANSNGGGEPHGRTADTAEGLTEIYDLTDPENPVHVQDWRNGYGCHDISFYMSPAEEKFRAYCAGIEMTQIWDVADPENPEVISNIPVHHGVEGTPSATVPLVQFSHLAMVNHDASVLIVGDETGGGLTPACDAYVDAQARTLSGPVGNLYFYDLSDEKNPELRSWLSPTHHYPTNPPHDDSSNSPVPAGCTAHFGREIQDTNVLAIAFYGAGVLLVDFNDLDHPVIVDQWNENTNVWDVWYYQGYLFTGDIARGMDVFGIA